MDENHVMSTSILQFLEEFKTHMKNNVMHSIQNEAGLLSEYQPLNKDNDRGVLFESENADNFEFDNHEFLHEEQVKLFDSKLNLKEDSFDEEELKENGESEGSKNKEEDFAEDDIDEKIK